MDREIDFYSTVAEISEEILYKDKNSKFFAQVFPISTEEEVKPIVDGLRKKYPHSNHVCHAWQFGIEKVRYRANDDGEPNNSAGMPIYGQIQSFGITNVLITVTRIFGGTKLGVGGLIAAYRTSAKMALEKAIIIKKPIEEFFALKFAYEHMDVVMRIIKQQRLTIKSQNMDLKCELHIAVLKSHAEMVMAIFESQPQIHIQKITA